MNNEITLKIQDYGVLKTDKKIKLSSLMKELNVKPDIIAATVNSELVDLNYIIEKDCSINFLSVKSAEGMKVYLAGLKFVLMVAVRNIFGISSSVVTEHSVDKGILCSLNINNEVTKETIEDLKDEMNRLVEANLPIIRINASTNSVEKYFKAVNETEKEKLYSDFIVDSLTIYKLDKNYNYFYDRMPISTGIINRYDLEYVKGNKFILEYPNKNYQMPDFEYAPSMIDVIEEYENFTNKINVKYLTDINSVVAQGKVEELVRLSEIEQSNRIYNLAKQIETNKGKIKVVLIGGPSSSGKTTMANKLALYLKTLGVNPFLISTDNYYKEAKDAPKDEFGNPDFDRVDSIDVDILNQNIKDLLEYKSVHLPTFNFKESKKEYSNTPKKLKENDILIIEGLHTMSDLLTKDVIRDNKFKIYISPLTPLSIDRHNHFSTRDIRLLRRMLRDSKFRNVTPTKTLHSWYTVRSGEDKYIFPYVKEADVLFNSSLIYELGVLRTYLEPLLHSIKKENDYYLEARRLIRLLNKFYPIAGEYVPRESILREFIGGSYFG